MATYYVREDGTLTAAEKAQATSDADKDTSLNRAQHNLCTFAAGDTIVISDAGGRYTNTIRPPSSGTLGNVINYIASGSPIIDGSKLITGWTAHGTYPDVWVGAWTHSNPKVVAVDRSTGYQYASDDLASMSVNGDWAFDTLVDEVYLYDDIGPNPDTYSNPGVAGNFVTAGFGIDTSLSYVTVDGICCTYCNQEGFRMWQPGPGITFKNCIGEYSQKGFSTGVTGGATYSGVIIEDCIGRWNSVHGINPGWGGTGVIVRRNACHHNGFWSTEQWCAGIKSFDDADVFSGYDCYENECYSNGRSDPGETKMGQGVGIWLDNTRGTTGANKVHHNYIHDNVGIGIFLEICKESQAYYNVLHDNASDSREWATSANIVVDTRAGFLSENNLVYNNTIDGGQRGIKVHAYERTTCELNNNIVKNNICVGFSVCALYCDNGGDNEVGYGSGNVYESNCFGAEAADFLNWGGVDYSTYDTWLAASSQADNNVEADPSFTNAVAHDYTLASNSPCIDAGVDLGSPYNMGLMPSSAWPSGVVTGDQDDY